MVLFYGTIIRQEPKWYLQKAFATEKKISLRYYGGWWEAEKLVVASILPLSGNGVSWPPWRLEWGQCSSKNNSGEDSDKGQGGVDMASATAARAGVTAARTMLREMRQDKGDVGDNGISQQRRWWG